jgi:hypothetical protein
MPKKVAPRPDNQLQLGDEHNYKTLLRAAQNGDLAIVRAREKASGEYRTLLCAIGHDGETPYQSPLAVMIWGDPFEQFDDPFAEETPA